MFSGLFFVSAICAHENRIAPVLPFGNISFIYPHPVRLIYLPRLGPALASPCPLLGAWLAFGIPPPSLPVRGEAPRKSHPSGSPLGLPVDARLTNQSGNHPGHPCQTIQPITARGSGEDRRRRGGGAGAEGAGLAGRGMGTRHTSTGGRGEGGEVGGRVAYMYMLPENSRPGIVVARRKGGAARV